VCFVSTESLSVILCVFIFGLQLVLPLCVCECVCVCVCVCSQPLQNSHIPGQSLQDVLLASDPHLCSSFAGFISTVAGPHELLAVCRRGATRALCSSSLCPERSGDFVCEGKLRILREGERREQPEPLAARRLCDCDELWMRL